MHLSPFSIDLLSRVEHEIEPSFIALREILHHIIKTKVVPWVVHFNLDVEIFKISIPKDWIELLESAELLDLEDEAVQDWWHSLIKIKSEIDDSKQKTIGDIGEKLTYMYEIDRIQSDEIPNGDKRIVWVSHISDEYGFDILSIAGKAYKQRTEIDNIYIEVKASELSNPKLFTFYITENEWKKAVEYDMDYYFYCWPGIKSNDEIGAFDKPFVIQ